jgi:glycosyltransferase involved in cell wall biosynthesis
MPMRVLHLYAGNLYGGIERLLVELARQATLCPVMSPHFALCFAGRLSEELRSCSATVHLLDPVRVSRPWTVSRVRRLLRELLRGEGFDAVITHACWPHALFAPVVRTSGAPLVYWAHDVPTGHHWLERWARRTRPDLVLANSRFTRAAITTLFPSVPCEVQYLPVPAVDARDRDRIRQEIRTALDTYPQAVVIILASRLERWKGHVPLLQALGRLRDVAEWACWIVGGVQRVQEAAYLKELQTVADQEDIGARIRFLGQRQDVPRLLAAADIHCQPNTGPEPFGVAFVEALASGLPVVTTALGGALEIIDQTCGMLTPPGDVVALAETLRALIGDPALRARLGAAGPERARRLCDPKECLSHLAGLLLAVSRSGNDATAKRQAVG